MSKGSAELRAIWELDGRLPLSPALAANTAARLFAQADQLELASLMTSIEHGDVQAASRVVRQILCGIAAAVVDTEAGSANDLPCADDGLLSPRELKVLALVAQGWSTRKVALALHRSDSTVASQIKSIYRKLSVHSRTQAVYEAVRRGLLRPSIEPDATLWGAYPPLESPLKPPVSGPVRS